MKAWKPIRYSCSSRHVHAAPCSCICEPLVGVCCECCLQQTVLQGCSAAACIVESACFCLSVLGDLVLDRKVKAIRAARLSSTAECALQTAWCLALLPRRTPQSQPSSAATLCQSSGIIMRHAAALWMCVCAAGLCAVDHGC